MDIARQIDSNQIPVGMMIGDLVTRGLGGKPRHRTCAHRIDRTCEHRQTRSNSAWTVQKSLLFTPIPTEIDPIAQKQTHFPRVEPMTQTGNNTSSSPTPSSDYSTIGRTTLNTEIETDRREFSTLYAEVTGRIGHLVLNRPASLNAINDTMLADLIEAVRWIDSHRELRVVIFKGHGRGFCAGADLNSLPFAQGHPETGNSWLHRREVGQIGTRLCEAIEQMHAVTIAQVHGCAVGGGVLFMIACDLRVVLKAP